MRYRIKLYSEPQTFEKTGYQSDLDHWKSDFKYYLSIWSSPNEHNYNSALEDMTQGWTPDRCENIR